MDELINNLEQFSNSQSQRGINKILEQEYDIEELAAKMPKYDNIRDRFYTKRNQDIPSLPKSLERIDSSLPRFQKTTYKKRFLLFDTDDKERIIAFASDIQLEILSKSKRWHVDDTFKCCPTIYYQILQSMPG
ncbi:unnamed protein product [Brachionus calyciflorus]|uniref:Uncharacterized protein n=1 Tax=Brachionus calyciflorus TaxID=104777 RepID=A0A814MRV1_9BILA|nr:unnamed protein product [Brachionus calyciflorus]